MKKLYFSTAIVMVILITFQSCSKQSPDQMLASPSSSNIIQANITPNQTYQLTLGNSINAGILKQASHFQVSHTELDTRTGLMTYKYIPKVDYSGTDEVVLSIIKASAVASTGCGDGQSMNNNKIAYTTSYTTLKIKVGDK